MLLPLLLSSYNHTIEQLKKGRASDFCQEKLHHKPEGIRMDTTMIPLLISLSFLVLFSLSFLHCHIPSTLLFKVKVEWSVLESHWRLAKAKCSFLMNTWKFSSLSTTVELTSWNCYSFTLYSTWKQNLFSTRSHVLPLRVIGPVLCVWMPHATFKEISLEAWRMSPSYPWNFSPDPENQCPSSWGLSFILQASTKKAVLDKNHMNQISSWLEIVVWSMGVERVFPGG